MTMIKVVNEMRIKKGRTKEVLALFAKAKSVHTFEGFIIMEVLEKENTEDYDELHISTTWKNHASFKTWRESRAMQKSHSTKNDKKQAGSDSPIIGTELSIYQVPIQHLPA